MEGGMKREYKQARLTFLGDNELANYICLVSPLEQSIEFKYSVLRYLGQWLIFCGLLSVKL